MTDTFELKLRKRCEICKHWQKGSKIFIWLGSDEKSMRYHSCARAYNPGAPADPESKAIAQDSEGYEARMLTRDDFCCIQFEAKDGS